MKSPPCLPMTMVRIGRLSRPHYHNAGISARCDLSRIREMMRVQPDTLTGIRALALALFIGLGAGERTTGQEANPLRVQVEVAPGPYHAGRAFELMVGVIAKGKEPKIDPPEIKGARAWRIGSESRPVSSTRIGSVTMREYQYVVTFRVLPARAVRSRFRRFRPRWRGVRVAASGNAC